MKPQITILPSHKIDTTKWDNCVAKNDEGLIYSTTNYLNFMAENWSGLVVEDYAAVMPLPWKKKLGIRYLYTPPFTQQLGYIGDNLLAVNQLQQALQAFIKYGDYLFNYKNTYLYESLNLTERSNYIINLNQPYQAIKNGYSKIFKSDLGKAFTNNLTYTTTDNFEATLTFYQQYNKKNLKHISNKCYASFLELCEYFFSKKKLVVRHVLNQNKIMVSSVILLEDRNRFYNIINYTTIEGRKLKANFFLYDNLFEEFSESPMLFDFEGSDLTGVKHFYKNFGANNQPYFQWHFNQLPWPLNYLKQ
ncbi:MAG: hypothetical protein H7068_00860 [Pedobacter sp.]|nr:hypothetical protein [Chitinophagaceae bacterium]